MPQPTVIIIILLTFFLSLMIYSCNGGGAKEVFKNPPNILFIVIDDLNADISAEGGPIKTPYIDKLASGGMHFTRAYVQQPVCAASRASFLTGLRPNTTGVDYPYSYYFVEELLPEVGILSDFFDTRNYAVKQFGKIHHGITNTYQQKVANPQKGKYVSDSLNENVKKYGGSTQLPYEKNSEGEEAFTDYAVATDVVNALKNMDSEKPFCMLAGFVKPHLPFSAPESYWDLYDRDDIALPRPKTLGEGTSGLAVDQYYLKQYKWETDDPMVPFSDDYARLIKHSYYASSSFVDHQVGRVMEALEENSLEENTIVFLISDHGFLIGEHNYWGKTNLFEKGLRVPFIVSWKGKITPGTTDALVEAVDIFPTMVELAGFEVPAHLEGTSLKPLLEDPTRDWKSGVYSQQPRGMTGNLEGVSLRTDRYRYTEWFEKPGGKVLEQELYDYEKDPTESRNLAKDTAYSEIVEKLAAELHEGWKAKLPAGIENISENPPAPPSYAWGPEGVNRRAAWHRKFGGSEEDGWREATRIRAEEELIDF